MLNRRERNFDIFRYFTRNRETGVSQSHRPFRCVIKAHAGNQNAATRFVFRVCTLCDKHSNKFQRRETRILGSEIKNLLEITFTRRWSMQTSCEDVVDNKERKERNIKEEREENLKSEKDRNSNEKGLSFAIISKEPTKSSIAKPEDVLLRIYRIKLVYS